MFSFFDWSVTFGVVLLELFNIVVLTVLESVVEVDVSGSGVVLFSLLFLAIS